MTTTHRQFDRRALFATGSAAALLAAVGVSAQAAPQRGGQLKVALSGGDRFETWHSHPAGHFLQAARNAVFETVTEVAPDGTLRPGLATHWTSEKAGRIWNLTIREDVSFHDGSALTVHDVVATLARQEVVRDVVCLPHTNEVQVSLREADAAFPFTIAEGAWSIFSARDLATGDLPTLGTGPYKIVRFDPGRGFLGQRVDAHYKDGDAGWFGSVELVAISSGSVRAEAVRDGFVDAADLPDAFDLEDRSDIELMTDTAGTVRAAIRKDVLHAARLGPHPLDALKFATRWWMQA